MKIEAKKLADLNKQYSKLKKDEKIISLTEAKKMLDDILEKQEKLEELLSGDCRKSAKIETSKNIAVTKPLSIDVSNLDC